MTLGAVTRPYLLIVTPGHGKETQHQYEVRKALAATARSRGWEVLPLVRTVTIGHAHGAARGRKVDVLTPQDTETVYRSAHTMPLALLATGSFKFRRDPRADPSTERLLWSPEDFLRYKAHARVVRAPSDVDRALQVAASELAALDCLSVNDPRVLPMHVFSSAGQYQHLDQLHGRNDFKAAHGSGRQRRDDDGRRWTKGPSHGREQLCVGGSMLPTGFHWDVTVERGSSTLANGWQVWDLVDRHAYVNIAPDAGVRKGNRCVRRWPK